MIRINEDWVIDVDGYNYILRKDLHKETKQKSGKGYVLMDAFYTAGYYRTLESALDALNEIIIKDRLSKADYALAEAVAVIKECREEWEKLVEKIDEVTHG